MTTYLGMSDVYSTAIPQSGGSKMNQCQWFNLVTVCKYNFVLPLFTFRLSGPCINCALLNALYCFKLTGNQTSLITVVLASEMGLYYFVLTLGQRD